MCNPQWLPDGPQVILLSLEWVFFFHIVIFIDFGMFLFFKVLHFIFYMCLFLAYFRFYFMYNWRVWGGVMVFNFLFLYNF